MTSVTIEHCPDCGGPTSASWEHEPSPYTNGQGRAINVHLQCVHVIDLLKAHGSHHLAAMLGGPRPHHG